MRAEEIYTERLTPFRSRPGFQRLTAKYAIWLAADHLMEVSRTPYRETYRRYYYRDIQALTLTRTRTHLHLMAAFAAGVMLLLGAGAGIVAFAASSDPPPWLGLVVFVSLMLGLLLSFGGVSGFWGPTCLCNVRTPIQTARLSSFGRWRRDLPAFERICERVAEAQGALAPEELESLDAPLAASPPPLHAPPSPRRETGHWHLWLYTLLFIIAGQSGLSLWAGGLGLYLAGLALWFGLIGVGVAAARAQRASTLPRRLRRFTGATLAYIVAASFAAMSLSSAAAWFGGMEGGTLNLWAGSQAAQDWPIARAINMAVAALNLLFGFAGLALTLDYRSRLRASESTQPS